ncbi:hypothetical protein C2S53_004726 [Perilla frutescens var. hirtella]|uniref:Uncharacterized protein n=1 Tax=Perilla frutescens var. hirtella TaxID=608512 RepID=A0AAD4J4N5_PERFH|nr:hypothetical protein C2S53_004726 [Perilla frutescens var. hirtella]
MSDAESPLKRIKMSDAEEVKFSLNVMINKEKSKPLGRIVKLLEKHYGDKASTVGSLNSLYHSLANLDSSHFCTDGAKLILLNPTSCFETDEIEQDKEQDDPELQFKGPMSRLRAKKLQAYLQASIRRYLSSTWEKCYPEKLEECVRVFTTRVHRSSRSFYQQSPPPSPPLPPTFTATTAEFQPPPSVPSTMKRGTNTESSTPPPKEPRSPNIPGDQSYSSEVPWDAKYQYEALNRLLRDELGNQVAELQEELARLRTQSTASQTVQGELERQPEPQGDATRLPPVQQDVQRPPPAFEEDYDYGYNSYAASDYEADYTPQGRAHHNNYKDGRLNNIKMSIPEFEGLHDPDIYLDWEHKVEKIFACYDFSKFKKVQLACLEFRGYAASWWEMQQERRRKNHNPPIDTWEEMKELMREEKAKQAAATPMAGQPLAVATSPSKPPHSDSLTVEKKDESSTNKPHVKSLFISVKGVQKAVKAAAATSDRVFTKRRQSFIISDDLQISPCVTGLVRIISILGITDTDKSEPIKVTLGFTEIMNLLKASLISQTPLSDIILIRTRQMNSVVVEPEPEASLHKIEKEENPNSKKIILKVMIQKSTGKLLYAQAEADFVQFLLSFLSIPLGGVECLLAGKTCIKTINNLYRSTADHIDDKYFKTPSIKNRLIKLNLLHGCVSKNQILPLTQEYLPEIYGDTISFSYVNFTKEQGNYLEWSRTYQVIDDLTVIPFCIVFILSTLNEMKIPISDVKELELQIGLEEALSILKASLTSTSALIDGLQKHISNQLPKPKLSLIP